MTTDIDYDHIPRPMIDTPRWRASTIVGLLTWVPTTRSPNWHRHFGNWSVNVDPDTGYRSIYHYGTRMLGIRMSTHGNGDGTGHTHHVDHTNIGWGSVSDQQMMNRLFRALDCDLYFSRAGGACIGRTAEF